MNVREFAVSDQSKTTEPKCLRCAGDCRVATVRITDHEGMVLANFEVRDPILSAEEIALYFEDEAHDRFDAEAL